MTVHIPDVGLSPNQWKLLYLISLYAVASNSTKLNERWVRQIPLFVLMFECIGRSVLDFDYAPASIRLSYHGRTLRRWINISREGKAALDELWEARLVNGIKLSSDDFQPITAYQVSVKGRGVLLGMRESWRKQVDAALHPPPPHIPKIFQVSYNGEKFYLRSGSFLKASAITESEDVSYVSSPFLPRCLRSSGYYQEKVTCNRHRVEECAVGVSNMSKSANEAITLGMVYSLVGEWVPFGSNQIVALNERMGALDRCQGGILTSHVDRDPTDAQFKVPVGLTQVRILDFDLVHFINFEAESHFPETSGIVQVENFGMHLNSDGSLIYGIKVEAIMDRKEDDISIDHLSRLLVDVHQDSSVIVNDLLSQYQLSLLEMLYLGDSSQRNKYNCIFAKEIKPSLPALAYVENACYANELSQVLGDIRSAHDISDEDVLIIGKAGCLLSGPHIFQFEALLATFVGLVCRDLFIRNFFARTFILDATLKEIRGLIHHIDRDPETVFVVRDKLAMASKDTILLAETLEYLLESLEDSQVTKEPEDPVEAKVFHLLSLEQRKEQTLMRCHDSIKLMEGTMLQLEQLQMIADSTATNRLEGTCQKLNLNTRSLMNAYALQEKTSWKLQTLQYVCAGSFTFDVIDRLSGGTWNIELPSWVADWITQRMLSLPFLWWTVNLFVALLVCSFVRWLFFVEGRRLRRTSVIKIEINRRISVKRLENMLLRKRISRATTRLGSTWQTPAARPTDELDIDSISTSSLIPSRFRLLKWQETNVAPWCHMTVHFQVYYDAVHEFLLFVSMRISPGRGVVVKEDECVAHFDGVLASAGVFDIEPPPRM